MFSTKSSPQIQIVCVFTILLAWASITLAEEVKIPQQVLDYQKAATEFIDANDISSAVAEYQKIISTFPDSDYAIDAQSKVVGLYLRMGQRTQADAALEELMSNDSDSVAFREAIHGAGAAYRWAGDPNDPAKGRQIYTRWLDKYSTDPQSYKIQCAVVKTYLEENNIDGANTALERFKQLCAGRADVYHETSHLADVYQQKGYPEKSLQLHQWFVTEFPQHEKISQSYSAQILVASKMEPAVADKALDEVMSNHSGSVAFREGVHVAGTVYRWEEPKDPARGRQIYNRWLDKYSDDPESYKIQCAVVKTYFEEEDIAGADKALERFKQLCTGQADVHHEMSQLADIYLEKGHPEKSQEIYRWYAAFDALEAAAGQVKLRLRLGEAAPNDLAADELDADTVVGRLMTEYKDAPRLGLHIFQIGEGYYVRGKAALQSGKRDIAEADLLKAIHIWELNIQQIEDSDHKCLACYQTANTFQDIGQYDKAIEYFQQVVTNWPTFDRAWNAQFQIASCYDRLCGQQKMSVAEAQSIIIGACHALEEKYPNSKASEMAQMLLAKYEKN